MTPWETLEAATAPENASVSLPGAMLVFAHPDDETIALGARLGRMRSAHLVHGTDGAPRNGADSRAHGFASLEDYRLARAAELRRALSLAGLADLSSECLGIPDQEAALNLSYLSESIVRCLRDWEPEVVFTHPYEGGHPDHDACAFAVHSAVRRLRLEKHSAPIIVECAFYNAGPEGIVTGSFLPQTGSDATIIRRLSTSEILRKQELLACFCSQRATLQYFRTEAETFRIAPTYDFTQPPHAGRVFYDGFPWGMNSGRFSRLAAEAELLTYQIAGPYAAEAVRA